MAPTFPPLPPQLTDTHRMHVGHWERLTKQQLPMRRVEVGIFDPYDSDAGCEGLTLDKDVPTIALVVDGVVILHMTWDEAEALALTLADVTSVARDG